MLQPPFGRQSPHHQSSTALTTNVSSRWQTKAYFFHAAAATEIDTTPATNDERKVMVESLRKANVRVSIVF